VAHPLDGTELKIGSRHPSLTIKPSLSNTPTWRKEKTSVFESCGLIDEMDDTVTPSFNTAQNCEAHGVSFLRLTILKVLSGVTVPAHALLKTN